MNKWALVALGSTVVVCGRSRADVVDASASADAASKMGILKTVNDRLANEFIGADGLVLDYVGDIPTPEEIAELKPNAMGWWCPIENGLSRVRP